MRRSWAFALPAAGGTPRRLDLGPVSDVALGSPTVLLSPTMSREMAWWKRYRGGTAGKLWWDPAGSGEFTRLLAELDGKPRRPDARRLADRLPLRPRGSGEPLLRRARR